MTELKSCPFCGGEILGASSGLEFIYCQDCGAHGPYISGSERLGRTRTAWNTRSDERANNYDHIIAKIEAMKTHFIREDGTPDYYRDQSLTLDEVLEILRNEC